MKHRVDASGLRPVSAAASERRPGRSTPALRVAVVLLALLWTQLPPGGGASADERHELALCCAWGKSLDDSDLTYSVSSADVASGEVVRQAIREWDDELPALTLTELPPGSAVDIAVRYIRAEGRTEGQAVTSFTRRDLIARVEVSVQGAPAPMNRGGLSQIAKHEFGHALGLGHSNYEGNLMSPSVNPEPQPIPPCVAQGVIEANRWKMLDPVAKRPRAPKLSRVSC